MSELKVRYDECNSLEKFIWDRIAVSFGDFEGLRPLSFDDLIVLQAKASAQITIELEKGE
jgi:hypothetical protein